MIGNIGFSLYWMLFGVTCTTLGYSSIQIGILARVMHGLRPRFVEARAKSGDLRSRNARVGVALLVVGLILLGHLVYRYLKLGLHSRSYLPSGHSRSSARHPRIPDILFHPAHGNGATRHLDISGMSPRADESYGQRGLTMADRLGVWLSQRAIRRYLPRRNDLEVLELGCGYRATQLIALEPRLKRGIGVDFQIAPELQTLERFTFYQASNRGDTAEAGERNRGCGDAYLGLGTSG